MLYIQGGAKMCKNIVLIEAVLLIASAVVMATALGSTLCSVIQRVIAQMPY